MGADAQGVIIDMGGQCDELFMFEASCYSSTGGTAREMVADIDSSTLTDSSLQTECAKGANGNVACKIDWTNSPDFDGLTAGIVVIRIHWRAK